MKKTKLFSRIFAAALAAAITATTLITNSGTGLLAFAGTSETYSVNIISPDVPSDGSTYSYNFYRIIDGDVEDDGGENVLGNPKWGVALGGTAFDDVPTGKTPVGSKYAEGENVGVGYYSSSEVLLGALSGYMSCDQSIPGSGGAVIRSSLTDSAHKKYVEILKSYGVYTSGEWMNDAKWNYFYAKFQYYLRENGTYSGNGKTRDVAGLVEVLNDGLKDGKLKTADLRAFADLLLNGVEVTIDLGTDGEGNALGTEKYTYNFITGKPQYTQMVESDGTFEVKGLVPGYYLVTCVGADNKLSNNGYETSMPIKPVSTMLILVGPANKGVAEIVGKNAYTVPTVTLEMYQKPVKLDMGDVVMKTGNGSYGVSGAGGYEHDVVDIEKIIKEDNWKNTGSFDYYEAANRKEAILYRIGITLPQNFDQYDESGYFLAVLDQYCHFNTNDTNPTAISTSGEIDRVDNVRPYVYVKSGKDYTFVGRCSGNSHDSATVDSDGKTIFKATNDSIPAILTNDGSNTTYKINSKLGFNAYDLFFLGDLYTHTTNIAENGTTTKTHTTIYKPGDTIYIYYPAILKKANVFDAKNYLLNANRVLAVYSNNPYAKELALVGTNTGYNHVTNGEVGVTPISEANVNTYGVKLTVDGDKSGTYAYENGAKFALYREVTNSEGETTKEYAFATMDADSYVKEWISESDLQDELKAELEKDEASRRFTTIEGALLNYSKNSSTACTYLATAGNGITTAGVTIKGLAAGEYYLQELAINSGGLSSNKYHTDNSKHSNKVYLHYKLAEEPIKFNIGNEYNQSVEGYLGVDDNQKTFISKLTVDFKQDNPERAIDTYILKPLEAEFDDESQAVKNTGDKDGHVVTNLATKTYGEGDDKVVLQTYATQDGEIEILVYHKTINLIWLPETGGIGTTIFFIVGGTIVVAATVLIVTRFRVKRERL